MTSGDDRVDAALAVLDELERTPAAGHVALFDEVHRRLQEALASADGETAR